MVTRLKRLQQHFKKIKFLSMCSAFYQLLGFIVKKKIFYYHRFSHDRDKKVLVWYKIIIALAMLLWAKVDAMRKAL